jgi:hypothetical protein
MPRRLGSDLCELKIRDNISSSDIVLYYRMPTSQERIAYTNESFSRRRNKIEIRLAETRQKFGSRILAGIREGDFEKQVGGKYVPIASDPGSTHYDPNWRKHIEEHASDLIGALAAHVFDVSIEMIDDDDLDAVRESSPEAEDIEKD